MIQPDRSGRAEFQDEDVVACYVHRTDYPAGVHARLLSLMPRPGQVLDLGCGPGKMARALAADVEGVLAVDPSPAMLRLGQALDGGAHPNIRWTLAAAEDLALQGGSLDLAVVGAAVHWMDAAAVFPKLARALAPGAVLALVDGDGPAKAPWREAYRTVIVAWVERLGGRWNDEAHHLRMTAHEPWFDIQGRETFTAPARQRVDDLIAGEHSRATWSRARIGPARAAAFDADLRAALEPWAEDGVVAFEVSSTLAWGRPLAARR